jgi:parallel beta-helix repeat protein
MLIIACLFAFSTKACRFSVKADSPIYVDDDGGVGVFTTIQAAVDAANPGDTIFVRNGTYFEHVFINKSLSIVGENLDSTIVDASGTGTVIRIYRSVVNFSGFSVTGSGASASDSGILLDHSSGGAVISGNKIFSNTNGISLVFSNNNTISNNNITSNSINGIYLFSSGGNIICGNDVSSSFVGIYFDRSSNNFALGNTLYSNDFYGVYLAASYDNLLYHNNFNDAYPIASELTNIWSLGNEGNYWTKYTGLDLNSDGIGDTPYDIDLDNHDSHPLMGRFYDFNVIFNGKSSHVEIVSNSSILDFSFETVPERKDRIIRFNAICLNNSAGFSRISIPVYLMSYPFIVLLNNEEVTPNPLNITDGSRTCIYLPYPSNNCSIAIIYSEVLHLYNELLEKYAELQGNFSALNATYNGLVNSYNKLQTDFFALNSTFSSLQNNFQVLQTSFQILNTTFYSLLESYNSLLTDLNILNNTCNDLLNNYNILQEKMNSLNNTYTSLLNSYDNLQASFYILNSSYDSLLSGFTLIQGRFQTLNTTFYSLYGDYNNLLGNYSGLQKKLNDMNASYQEHLRDYSEQQQNFRSLMYIFAATTAIFIITTVYLSKKAHAGTRAKTRTIED